MDNRGNKIAAKGKKLSREKDVYNCGRCGIGNVILTKTSWVMETEIKIKPCAVCRYQYGLREIFKERLTLIKSIVD